MATKERYKGIEILDSEPTGAGGKLIQDNFVKLMDMWFPIDDSAYNNTPASTIEITMLEDFSNTLKENDSIRVTISSVELLSTVNSISSGLLTLNDPILTDTIEKLEFSFVNNKTDKVIGATENNLASFDDSGNLKDAGSKASDFATKEDSIVNALIFG